MGPNGEVTVVWEDFELRQILGVRSTDFGVSFSPPFVVAPIADNLGTLPPGYDVNGDRRNPVYVCGFEFAPAFPAIATDVSSGPNSGNLYVAWPEYADGTVGPASGNALDAEPNNNFVNASSIAVGQDVQGSVVGPHGGPSCCVDLYALDALEGETVWIDGVVLSSFPPEIGGYAYCHELELLCGKDTVLAPTLATLKFGEAWRAPMPPLIYRFPQTGRYYLRVASYYYSVQYRLRLRSWTPDTTLAARDQTDIVLVSSSDGGATWSPKVRLNDDPPGFGDFLPALAVDSLGRLHSAWYDWRDDPACGALANTYWTYSTNGGKTFASSRRVSTESSSWGYYSAYAEGNVGDHLGMATSGKKLYLLWTQRAGPASDIHGAPIVLEPTPVEVSGLTAEIRGEHVLLSWVLADASGVFEFLLERAEGENGPFESLRRIRLRTPPEGSYEERDDTVRPGETYRYRLGIVERDGTTTWRPAVEVSIPVVTPELRWTHVGPNPFRNSLELSITVPEAGTLDVRLYDVSGREVRRVWQGPVAGGRVDLRWSEPEGSERALPAGVYFLKARFGRETATEKITRSR